MDMEKYNTMLQLAIQECQSLDNNSKIRIRTKLSSKFYTSVATRLEIFRKHFLLNARIIQQILESPSEIYRIKTTIEVLIDSVWFEFADGLAEEKIGSTNINETSALENCSTSSIGRALANLGIHGGEFASSNEVELAISKNDVKNKLNNEPQKPKTVTDEELTGYIMRVKSGARTKTALLASFDLTEAQISRVNMELESQEDKDDKD